MDESVHIVKAQPDAAAKALDVAFSDGATGSFAYVWLRDNAVHEGIVHDTQRTQYRLWPATDIDTEIEPVECELTDKDRVTIKWPGVPEPVLYTARFLHEHNMADGRVVSLREQLQLGAGERVLWTADRLRAAFASYDFEKFLSDPVYALRACDFFVKYGLVHFVNYGGSGANERLGDYFGYLVPSHYGKKMFYVRNQASGDRSNAAYSTGTLNHHMDLAFIQYPPHIQVLHAVEQAGQGGDNVFSDALRIAEAMRRDYPEHFAVLSTQPLEFYDRGVDPDGTGEFYTVGRRLGADGSTVERVCYHNHGRSWYMPNTGGEPAKVRRVYEAFVRLNKLMADPEYEFRIKLNAGEAVMFANDRVSHSRLAFELAEGESRCYEGCYLHWDMVRSKIRLLKIENGVPVSPSV